MSRRLLVALTFSLFACRGPSWEAGAALVATPRKVADALEDPTPAADFSLAAVPRLEAPHKTRPCCALGMDLDVDLRGVPIPGYEIGNILAPDELSGHEYDNGAFTLKADARPVAVEPNGLVYTCRGGVVDIAHVRDNADLTLFATLAIVKLLPAGGTIEMPGDGARRRVTIAPLAAEEVERIGKLEVATAIAQWVVYDLSVWHELATWQGWESTPGFSERLSAFSPEDLYSNLLGIRIAGGAIADGGYRSRESYNQLMDGWITEALQRLGARPKGEARAVMHALDGALWDSTLRVPDVKLVKRRFFPQGMPLTPWRAEDVVGEGRPELAACKNARTLPLRVADRVGSIMFEDSVAIEWEPEAWAGASFPFPDPKSRVVTHKTLSDVVAATRTSMREVLGAGFDAPKGAPNSP